MQKQIENLTKYHPASIKEIVSLSIPIMISALSGLLMSFIDRIILSQFATDAMNAAITAGMTANIFTYGAIGVALIAEVFVGKTNGAKQFGQVARPVWQMIWFSLFTAIIFYSAALFFSEFLVPLKEFRGQAQGYFKVWMLFGPAFPMVAALSSFFIGRGKVKIVTFVTIFANVLNVVLDYLFIFGVNDLLPAMGTNGAALATGLSQVAQLIIFASIFLSRKNNARYKTRSASFDSQLFWQCIKVGGPSAVGHMIEIAAWALLLRLMTKAGEAYISVLAIGQTMHLLFAFATEGLQKGVTTVAANLIGAQKEHLIKKLIGSALLFLATIMGILFIPLAIYPDPILQLLLLDEFGAQKNIYDLARMTGVWVWLYLFLDGCVWVFAGVLTAYSDTKFIMVANALTAWFFALVPTYIAINIYGASPHYPWVIVNLYGFLNMSIFVWRLKFSKKII